MRVMFVITRGDIPGGAQSHVRDLASRLVADGHEAVVAVGSTGPLTEALTEAGVPWVVCRGLLREIHPWHDARAVASLVRIIRRFRPTLITTHSSKAGMVGRLAAAATGTPCLYTVHGWAFNDGSAASRRALYRWFERTTAPLTAKIICVSEHDRRIGEAAGIRSSRLVTIHNGIPDVSPNLRAEPGKPGLVRVVMVARFAPPKDHATLLHAIRDVDDVELDLVGDGPLQPAATALARDLGIEGRVHFLGRRADVAALLARAHVLALTSHSEGFPLSTLEAMRAGLPVVISAVGGAPEAVEEGVTGFLVGRGDVAGLRDRLRALAGDQALRNRLGQAARARFEALYTLDRMYAATLAVYDAVAPTAVGRAPVAT